MVFWVSSSCVPGHILLDRSVKPSYIPQQFEGQVVNKFGYYTVMRQILMEGNHLVKKYQWQQDELSLF